MKDLRLPMVRHGSGMMSLFRRLGNIVSPFLKRVTPMLKRSITAAKPLLREGAREVAQTGINTAADTLGDIVTGKSPKTALEENLNKGVERIRSGVKRKASNFIQTQVPIAEESGSYKKRKKKGKGHKSIKKGHGVKTFKIPKKYDIF